MKRFANYTVGGDVLHDGEGHEVLNIESKTFSDLGCGSVHDIYTITMINKETGSVVEINLED